MWRGRGRGKYVCEECGIRCKKPSMLKKHIRTHTDVRPYACKHCHFALKPKVVDGQRSTGPARCRELPSGSSSTEPGPGPSAWGLSSPTSGLQAVTEQPAADGSTAPSAAQPVPLEPLLAPPTSTHAIPTTARRWHSSTAPWFCI